MRILITGGASGLGEAVTRRCAAESDCQVHFTYHRSADNAARLEAEYPNARSIACDFNSETDLEALKGRIGEMDIDVLINNAYAGAFIRSHFHKTNPGDFLDGFVRNVVPTVAITQAAIQCFRRRKSGKIITILTSALIGAPPIGACVYLATKACLAGLSRVWATENARFNVTSNTVSPAFMRTSFTSGVDERVVDQILNEHPLKRLLTTAEAAEAVLFLCKASQQINGIDIPINASANAK